MPGENINITPRVFPPDELALEVEVQTSWQGKVTGFTIRLRKPPHGVTLEYMARLPSDQDSDWTAEGQLCGGTGVIEGFAVRLTGPNSAQYRVQYRANLEVIGQTAYVVDGAFIGTRRTGLAVMGIEVRVRLRTGWLSDLGGDPKSDGWINWGRNKTALIAEHYWPTTLQQLLAILQRGIADNQRVRAIGSSWCYSDAGIPDFFNANRAQPHGYLVETSGLAGFLGGPYQGTLSGLVQPHSDEELLVHVEAGITVHALHKLLDKLGFALVTAGGSGGQSICGALSTGTHGGDFFQPPIADMVRAIQLVAADGSVYWIEKTRFHGAVSDPDTIHKLAPHIDPSHVIYDDATFNSVLVSIGAMGAIYSLVIAVRPRYALQQTIFPSTWFDIEKLILDGSLFHVAPWQVAQAVNGGGDVPPQNGLGTPRFVEIAMPPNSVIGDNGNRICMVTLRCETNRTLCSCPGEPQSDLLATLQAVSDYRPLLALFAGLVKAALPAAGGALAALGSIAPLFEPFLPGVTAIVGHAVVTGAIGLLAAYPLANKLANILDAASQQPGTLNLEQAMVFIFQAAQQQGIAGALPAVNKLLLPFGRKAGSVVAPSYALMGNSLNAEGKDTNLTPNHFITDSVELFFDASDPVKLLGNINYVLGELDKGEFGGYVSLRFTGPTSANLGMQNGWSRNCAIEVTFMQGFQQNDAMLRSLQRDTVARGGRLHWGQLNDELLVGDVHSGYPQIKQWKMIHGKLSHNFSVPTFHNAFTGRLGLDGPPLVPTASIAWKGSGIVSTHNLISGETTGVGTFHITTSDMAALAQVTWNGAVAGSTVDGTATLHFTNAQGPQTVTVEAIDIFGDKVAVTAQVPVVPGPNIGGPPIRRNFPH